MIATNTLDLIHETSLVCALVLVTHTTGNTQTVSAGTEFLNALLKEEKALFITYPRALPRPLENIGIPFEKPDATTPVIFVFASGRLFGIPDGTGFVFEIRENNAHIKVTRVDSTIYFGYNFGAMVFPFEGKYTPTEDTVTGFTMGTCANISRTSTNGNAYP